MIDKYKFLLNLLFDEYQLFLDNEKKVEDLININDIEYFNSNYQKLLTYELMSGVYNSLLDLDGELEYDLSVIVPFMCSRYVMYNYDNSSDKIISLCKNASTQDMIDNFIDDEEIALRLIHDSLMSFVKFDKTNSNLAQLLKDNNISMINKWRNKDELIIEGSVNDDYRKCISDLFDHLISLGYDRNSALTYTWQFFERDFDPTGINIKYGNVDNPFEIKMNILRLMYADLYENACNSANLEESTDEERKLNILVILSTQLGIIQIPEDDLKNLFLNTFIELTYDYERRKNNRSSVYSSNSIFVLNKINPSYMYDELTY